MDSIAFLIIGLIAGFGLGTAFAYWNAKGMIGVASGDRDE